MKLKLHGQQVTVNYEDFPRKYSVKQEEFEAQRSEIFEYQPKFSIVVPLFKTREKFLTELIESVQAQIYGNWELCFADGSGTDGNLQKFVEEQGQEN